MATLAQEIEPLTGRFGLNVPSLWVPERGLHHFDILGFFSRFWEMNGHPEGSPRERLGRLAAYSLEMVVPAGAGKPLVLMRSQMILASPSQQVEDRRRSRLFSEGWSENVTLAKESHEVITPPDTPGAWLPLVEVSYTHRSYCGPAQREFQGPSIRIDGQVQPDLRQFTPYQELEAAYGRSALAAIERVTDLLT